MKPRSHVDGEQIKAWLDMEFFDWIHESARRCQRSLGYPSTRRGGYDGLCRRHKAKAGTVARHPNVTLICGLGAVAGKGPRESRDLE